jgi:hypothetical protein
VASPNIPPLQFFSTTGPQVGFDLTNYLIVNGGGNVLQVRSTGSASGERPGLQGRLFPSIASAAQQCRANRGDIILALEGHVETAGVANYLTGMPAGVTIIGQGRGSAQAQLNFTAAASTLMTTLPANTIIANMNMNMNATAATLVAAPITITTADCALLNNRMTFSTSATQQATAPITVAAGGDRFSFIGNEFYGSDGTFATNPTNGILVSAAVLSFTCAHNKMTMATNATGTGVLQFSAAALDVLIANNYFQNNKAASTAAVVGFAGVTGYCVNNHLAIQAATGGATALATIGSMLLDNNLGVALGGAGHTGVLIGTASS